MQGAISVGDKYDIEIKSSKVPGDYLYRSGSLRWGVKPGMWGIFRVVGRGMQFCCENICRKVYHWWERKWFEK